MPRYEADESTLPLGHIARGPRPCPAASKSPQSGRILCERELRHISIWVPQAGGTSGCPFLLSKWKGKEERGFKTSPRARRAHLLPVRWFRRWRCTQTRASADSSALRWCPRTCSTPWTWLQSLCQTGGCCLFQRWEVNCAAAKGGGKSTIKNPRPETLLAQRKGRVFVSPCRCESGFLKITVSFTCQVPMAKKMFPSFRFRNVPIYHLLLELFWSKNPTKSSNCNLQLIRSPSWIYQILLS